MEWIKCSERMPENEDYVLCLNKSERFGNFGAPFVSWHDAEGWVGHSNYRPTVTHWMPIPEKPVE